MAEVHVVPLHISDEISSLSAILLDNDYYAFMKDGRKEIDGISVLDELHLILFKAKAWCELTIRHTPFPSYHHQNNYSIPTNNAIL